MDQNYVNNQMNTNGDNREPLPTYGAQPQYGYAQPPVAPQPQSQPQYGYAQQPYQQYPQYAYGQQQPTYAAPAQQSEMPPAVVESADSAFRKSLTSVIMSLFPITSIIAIFMGSAGLNGVKATNELAARFGLKLGGTANGKTIAARIMGIVGLASGIFFTLFYSFYFLVIIAMAS